MSTVIDETKTNVKTKSRQELKKLFSTGAIPKEKDFADVFDAFLNLEDDAKKLDDLKKKDEEIDANVTELSKIVDKLQTGSDSLSKKVDGLGDGLRTVKSDLETAKSGLKNDLETTKRGLKNDLETIKNNLSNRIDIMEKALDEIIDQARHSGAPPRAEHSSVVHNNRIFIMGGSNSDGYLDSIAVYSKTPEAIPSLFNRLRTVRYAHSSVIREDKVYVIGGCTPQATKSIEVYRINDQGTQYDKGYNLSQTRWGHTSVINGNKIYTIGGLEAPNKPIDSIEITNIGADGTLVTDTQQPKYSSFARAYHSSVFHNGMLYIIGGMELAGNTLGKFCDNMLVTDTQNQWESYHNNHAAVLRRRNHSSVIVGNRIYVIGGESADQEGSTYKNYHFLKNIDVWQIWEQRGLNVGYVGKAMLKVGRAFHTSVVIDKKIYVIGGRIGESRDQGKYTNNIEVLDTDRLVLVK